EGPNALVGERTRPFDVERVQAHRVARGVHVDHAARGAAHEANAGLVEEITRVVGLARGTPHEASVRARRAHRGRRLELERPGFVRGRVHGVYDRRSAYGWRMRNSSVSTTLSSIVFVGAHPRARMRVVSSRMRG